MFRRRGENRLGGARSARILIRGGLPLLIVGAAAAVVLWQKGAGAAVSIRAAGRSVFPLRTEVAFDIGEGEPEIAVVEGTGTVMLGRYVLTVAHAVTLERLERTIRTPRGEMTLPVDGRRLSEKTWLMAGDLRLPLTLVAREAGNDLAVFLLPRGTDLPTFPYPIGDSEALDLGDSIAVLGNDPLAGVLLRLGSVAALRGSGLVATVSRPDQVFLISLALASGESGAPVVAARAGGWEIVGLAQGTYIGPRQLAWAIRISPALEALSRAEPSTDLQTFLRTLRQGRVSLGLAVGTAGGARAGAQP